MEAAEKVMEKKSRPKSVVGETLRLQTGCGKMYVTVNKDNGEVIEVFTHLGKAGSCVKAQLEALTRTITLGLKYGVPVEEYIKELEGIKCPYPTWEDGEQILSCADAISKVIKRECRNSKSD